MTDKPGVTIIIPAYNEEEGILNIIKELKKLPENYDIIVVDDGSTDNTYEVARSTGIKVIRHPYNKGNGAAIKTGALEARGDVLLFMDGDGQHNPEYIPDVLQYIGEYDMVVGARTEEFKGLAIRNAGNRFLILLANYLTGFKIQDLTSGFRAIKKDVFRDLGLVEDKTTIEQEMVMKALKKEYRIKEIASHEYLRRYGKSKIELYRVWHLYIWCLLKNLF